MLRFILFGFLSLSLVSASPLQRQSRQEEKEDYFKKWLDEDVKYIISDEEKDVFDKLTTAEEREAFIEQFWFRRDFNPRTKENEFKD